MEKNKKPAKMLIPVISIVTIAILLIIIIVKSKQPLSVQTVLKYTPENIYLAVSTLFLFFALKSLTIILPLSALYLASGILFSPITAVFISICGLSITLTIPYLIGHFSGKEIVSDIQKKYPKVRKIMEYQETNTFFACFIHCS